MNMSNQQGQDDPIFVALETAANDPKANDEEPKLQRMPVQLLQEGGGFIETKAYYFSDAVKFRHAGISGQRPPCLYLKDLTSYTDKTLVYYSSSGSGKTSELAGSSATRGAHLAFVISACDPSEEDYQNFDDNFDQNIYPNSTCCDMVTHSSQDHPTSNVDEMKRLREKEKWITKKAVSFVITPTLRELFSTESARTSIVPVVQAAHSAGKALKLVLSIDEASSCPKVVRGILRFPKLMKSCVLQALVEGLNSDLPIDELKLEVSVSIGGTGVMTSSTIGSLPENFRTLAPSHEDIWAKVVDSTLSNLKLSLVVPWNAKRETFSSFNYIQDRLPVVSELMKNGRMGSIAMAALQKLSGSGHELKEGILAQDVVKLFIGSNGMSNLNAEEQREAAASALAVHLFRGLPQFALHVPESSTVVAEWASKMEFFDLATSFTVKELVHTFGLLEPGEPLMNCQRDTDITPPLKMTPPQQLVALFMLGLELESMLDPTWFGFELMSTHLVKCAITASLAIPEGKRPSVQETLELVGLRIDDYATSDGVKETWQELNHFTAVPSPFQNHLCCKTRQLNVGLKIAQSEYTPLTPTVFRIDKAWKNDLMELLPMDESDGCLNRSIVPPIACVNERNSSVSDGFVTFFVMRDNGSSAMQKVTIAIQAEDYHDQSRLDHEKLNEHAQIMSNEVLDGVLGGIRLTCVASGSSSLFATQDTATKREYMPYAVKASELLGDMLAALEPKRGQSYKAEKYACYCDEEGYKIPSGLVSRKRKHID